MLKIFDRSTGPVAVPVDDQSIADLTTVRTVAELIAQLHCIGAFFDVARISDYSSREHLAPSQ
ncbi:DUF1652 domain-containing protein [Pseudomonas sp. NFR16]|uniref:DUF1652 domain-containing protein n=1 Tax=Pseudomonas sp. NFR16 TaxID=1566248 RepID=UPI0008C79C36|nr:DUF1652 domain-containing protein [Pseudomonas sp. NFR16]SEI51218.1 Protein of unknown function [Pseudomonas sp. NFR16]